MDLSPPTTSIALGDPAFVEKLARKFTALMMGLKDDPDGERLPEELWKQSEGVALELTCFLGQFTFEAMRNSQVARASFMLSVAQTYIRQHPDGSLYYDGAHRDGFNIADDCETARFELLEAFPEREPRKKRREPNEDRDV